MKNRMSRPYSKFFAIVLLFCLFLIFQSCFLIVETDPESLTRSRNPNWAIPIKKPGLPNFHQVSGDLYRGAQPTAEGIQELQKIGIKTVVNLRYFHSDRDEIGDTKLASEHIRMIALFPRESHIIRFLRIMTDDARKPVFVHCLHGSDRTGVIVAAYRIVVQGRSKDEALEEMTRGGFGFHGFLKNLIWFIQDLDIDEIRQKAGLQPEQETIFNNETSFSLDTKAQDRLSNYQ